MIRRWAALARKAWGREPAAIARGVQREFKRQVERPWAKVHARRFDDAALLSATGSSSIDALWQRVIAQPFFVTPTALPAAAATFNRLYPDEAREVVARADQLRSREFDLLGSGPVRFGASLPWHTDFKTGRSWPVRYAPDLEFENLGDSSDVKVPWELSRCQHFTMLGLAYRLTGDGRYADEIAAEIDDWIASNPWMQGVNWICAMDVALRAVSWIWALYLCENAPGWGGGGFRARLLRALYMHGEFVAAHLEKTDVNGNHYLCDGVGLVFLGALFRSSPGGERWLSLGRTIVCDEILSQVHPDGVDFEKSVAYHRLVLEAFLTSYVLLQNHGIAVPAPSLDRLHAMCRFVAAYTGPDGAVPLIGDADDGRIQRLGVQHVNDHRYLLSSGAVLFRDGELRSAAGRCWDESYWLLGAGACAAFENIEPASPASAAFPAGGFYVMRHERTHVIIDCGEVGMDGRGGHGHNDILSFELVLDGTRVITDCGSFVYTPSREWRNRFRSTAMHNGVQVDDAEINRFISDDDLWRLHDDARPVDVLWDAGGVRDYFRGAHTGYDREPYRVRHSREIVLDKGGPALLVRDRLTGRGRHALTWRFHFVPGARTEVIGTSVRARLDGRDVWLTASILPASAAWRLEDAWVSPRYGVKVPATAAVLTWTGELPAEGGFLLALRPVSNAEAAAAFERFEMVS